MKLSCEIVKDLLPLYEDNVCSEQTKQAVMEHLQECETCRKLVDGTNSLPNLTVQTEKPAADQAIAKSFKRIRLRWVLSLLMVLLAVPVCILGWNQYTGSGIHFTNLHETYIASAFMYHLKDGNLEKAYQYIDIGRLQEEWQDQWFNAETLCNIESDGLSSFCEAAAPLNSSGGIQAYQYVGIRKTPLNYQIIYTVTVEGEEHQLSVNVTDDGISNFNCDGSFLEDPVAYFSMWSEWLWERYEGCYYDPESQQYIYYDTN